MNLGALKGCLFYPSLTPIVTIYRRGGFPLSQKGEGRVRAFGGRPIGMEDSPIYFECTP